MRHPYKEDANPFSQNEPVLTYLNTNGVKLPSLNRQAEPKEGNGVMPNLQKIISDLAGGTSGAKLDDVVYKRRE